LKAGGEVGRNQNGPKFPTAGMGKGKVDSKHPPPQGLQAGERGLAPSHREAFHEKTTVFFDIYKILQEET